MATHISPLEGPSIPYDKVRCRCWSWTRWQNVQFIRSSIWPGKMCSIMQALRHILLPWWWCEDLIWTTKGIICWLCSGSACRCSGFFHLIITGLIYLPQWWYEDQIWPAKASPASRTGLRNEMVNICATELFRQRWWIREYVAKSTMGCRWNGDGLLVRQCSRYLKGWTLTLSCENVDEFVL